MKAQEYRISEDKYEYEIDGIKVIEFPEARELIIDSPKHTEFFIVYKPVGKYNYFKVRFSSGKDVKPVDGQFMSLHEARNRLIKYIHRAKESPSVRAEFLAAEREKRKRAKQITDTSS